MIAKPCRYSFGDFDVDVDAWQLLHSGQLIHLEPTVLRLLVYLIENRDRLVEKEELLEKVWPAAFVSESALSQAVARLRRALGDDPARAKYVETVHSMGYRFVSPVQIIEGGKKEASAAAKPPRSALAASLRRAAMLAAAALAAVVLIAALRFAQRSLLPEDQGAPPIRSLAVLPLDNLTGEPERDYFVQGLHEALITDLSRVSGIRVISRQSVMRYQDSPKSAPEIARELNVDGLVEGGVLCLGDRVRITAQLIRAANDDHVWAESYELDVGDALQTLSRAARAIAQEVEIALTPEQKEALAEAGPVDPRVQEAYFRGRYLLNTFSSEGSRGSLPHFRQALQMDSSFAPAWSGIAIANIFIGAFFDAPPAQFLPQARAAALKAIESDDRLAEAYTALGMVSLCEWDWQGAEEALERALELNPNDALARHGWADHLTLMGRAEEGLEQVRLGYRLDPFAPVSSLPVGYHLYFMGRFDEAIAFALHLLEIEPEHPVRSLLSHAYWQKGMREESMAELRRALVSRQDRGLVEALDRGLKASGPGGARRAMAWQLMERSKSEYVSPFDIARAWALAEDIDLAFEWLEKALQERSPALSQLGIDPAFSLLSLDLRFRSLLSRMGLPSRTLQKTPNPRSPSGNALHALGPTAFGAAPCCG